jgi:Cohesin domain/Secretion system C-terminal sorting domain/Bacterial Ig-like domain (group 2)/Fibronectin type III domain
MFRTFRYLVAILLLPASAGVFAGTVGLSVHDSTVVQGKVVSVPVFVDSSLTGLDVRSFQLDINFDPFYFAFDSVVANGTMSQTLGGVTVNASTPGHIAIAAGGVSPLSGTGILVFIRLRAVQPGYSYVSFTGSPATLLNEGTPAVVLTNGLIHVENAPFINVYPSAGALTVGDSLQFTASNGVEPYTWSSSNTGAATIGSLGMLKGVHAGTTRVIVTDFAGTADTTGLVEVRAFGLSVHDTSAMQGRTVDLPVYASDLTGLSIGSGYLRISFNPSLLTPLSIVQTGTLLAAFPQAVSNSGTPGELIVSFAGSSFLSGSGVLFYVRFTVSTTNTGNCTIALTDILFNEDMKGSGKDGSFNATSMGTLFVSPSTAEIIVGDTLRFSATGGTEPYAWTVSDTSLAQVDNGGLLRAKKSGSETVRAVDVYGASGVTGAIQISDTRVAMPDTVGMVNDSIDVPIYISSVSAGGWIYSFQATISYDTSIMRAVKIVNAGTITEGWTYAPNISGNKVIFAAAGSSKLTSPGILSLIRFFIPSNVQSGRSSSITFDSFVLNEGQPRALLSNGSVETSVAVSPAAPVLVSPSDGASDVDINPTLNWNASAGALSYRIQVSIDPSFATTAWDSSGVTPTTVTLSGLAESTVYHWRVNAQNAAGISDWSTVRSFTTIVSAPPVPALSSPVSGSTDIAVNPTLTWSSATGAVSYRVQVSTDSSFATTAYDTAGVTGTSKSASGLSHQTVYYWRVNAANGGGTSGWSAVWKFTTIVAPPASPTGMTATAVSYSRINLAWSDNSTSESGYKLQRTPDTTGSWTEIAALPANSISYADTGLTDGTRNFYRAFAYNGGGNSGYSNLTSAVTLMRPPGVLTATQGPGAKVVLAWEDSSSSEGGFRIERKVGASGTFIETDTVGPNVMTYADSTVGVGQSYSYRVRGYNANITSAYSNEVSVTITRISGDRPAIPVNYALSQNYPNPFNPSTSIEYQIPENGFVDVRVFDVMGREVAVLVREYKSAGYYTIRFDGVSHPSGVYFFRILSGTFSEMRKMVLMK